MLAGCYREEQGMLAPAFVSLHTLAVWLHVPRSYGPPFSHLSDGEVRSIRSFSASSYSLCCCFSGTQSCLTLCDPMDCSTPGLLAFTISQSFLKPMSIELVMPSKHLVLCHLILLLPSIFLPFIWKDRHLPSEIDCVHIHTANPIPTKAQKATVYDPCRKGNKSNLTHHPSVC